MEQVRVKFGPNKYSGAFTCAHCGNEFKGGGFYLLVEANGNCVTVPICPGCWGTGHMFEGDLDMTQPTQSHPIGLA